MEDGVNSTRVLLTALLFLAFMIAAPVTQARQQFIIIGTGGVTGVYYPTGGAICQLVNERRRDHGIRCSIESTNGSVYNLRHVRKGDLDFGLVQSDVQATALEGAGEFAEEGPFADLRAVFSIYPEPVHVMVRRESGIEDLAGLAHKIVNVGLPGSGTRSIAELLLSTAGLETGDLAFAAELGADEQAAALCDGRIDASIWVAGIRNSATQEATATCAVRILPLVGDAVERLLAGNPAYARAIIPGNTYAGNPDDIRSWGPKATLVTSASVDDDVVYQLVRAVFDNIDRLRSLHPSFVVLREEAMIRDGLAAELHPGALRYYRERGWK
jgi:TRAP transporter TAXI family solute receptor